MTYTFESCFAARIEDFIAQKNALGFGYLESSRLLRDFDRFCMTHFPEENFLTEELCLAWATKKNTEGNNTFRNRMMPVREFARYLNRNGEAAYVLPPDIARKDAPYAPYIYTEDDILTIWDVFDHLKPRGGFPVRQYVIPAIRHSSSRSSSARQRKRERQEPARRRKRPRRRPCDGSAARRLLSGLRRSSPTCSTSSYAAPTVFSQRHPRWPLPAGKRGRI